MYRIFIDNDILNNWSKNPCLISNNTNYLYLLYIKLNKFKIIDNYMYANYIIINACNSEKNLTKDCSNKIFLYKKKNKSLKGIISIWCWAKNYFDIVDYVIIPWEEEKLDTIFNSVISFNKVKGIYSKKYKKLLNDKIKTKNV